MLLKGKLFDEQSNNCLLQSENRLLVTIGLENLIVVETADAMLVANKNNSENLKPLVTKLQEQGYQEGVLHRKIYRPWGVYTSLIENDKWLVKSIEVNPGAKLSLKCIIIGLSIGL